MIELFKQFLKFAIFGLSLLAILDLFLHDDVPLDAANWFGYWVFMPALIGFVLMLFDALWDWLAAKIARRGKGQWPKP